MKISTKSSYNKITNEDYKGTLPKIQKLPKIEKKFI